MKRLAEAGLNRIHVGLESGDDVVLKRIKKGTNSQQQITAGQWVMAAGMELSLYVILGIGGRDRTRDHASETARVLNEIGYRGPLSVEWEDAGMDREHGAGEACRFVKQLQFDTSGRAFDAAFEKEQ